MTNQKFEEIVRRAAEHAKSWAELPSNDQADYDTLFNHCFAEAIVQACIRECATVQKTAELWPASGSARQRAQGAYQCIRKLEDLVAVTPTSEMDPPVEQQQPPAPVHPTDDELALRRTAHQQKLIQQLIEYVVDDPHTLEEDPSSGVVKTDVGWRVHLSNFLPRSLLVAVTSADIRDLVAELYEPYQVEFDKSTLWMTIYRTAQ